MYQFQPLHSIINNFLSQSCYLCLNVQNCIKLCHGKNHKFGDKTTVCPLILLFHSCKTILNHYYFSCSHPDNYNKVALLNISGRI